MYFMSDNDMHNEVNDRVIIFWTCMLKKKGLGFNKTYFNVKGQFWHQMKIK